MVSYVLFYILLPDFDSALTHLEAHLGCVVVHEAAKRGREIGRCIRRLLLLLAHSTSIGTIVVTLLSLWRGW